MLQAPEPELHGCRERAGTGPRTIRRQPPHVGDRLAELAQEQLVRHRDAELAALLHGLGALVGGFELRIHPLVAEEAGAILRDPIAAHQADSFPHRLRAVAGVPQLAGRAEHVGDAIEQGILRERIIREFGLPAGQKLEGVLLHHPHGLERFRAAGDAALLHDFGLLLFERIHLVKHRARPRNRGSAGFAGGPNIHRLHHILLELQAEFSAENRAWRSIRRGTGRARSGLRVRPSQLGRSHNGHGHARTPEHGFNNLSVAIARHDHISRNSRR